MIKEKELTSRQRKSIVTQKNIIDAAIKVLREKGHEQFNVKNICEEADISVGGFYHHYKSVEILVMKAYNVDEAMIRRLEYENLTGSSKQRIIQIFKFQVEYIEKFGVDLLVQYYKGMFNHIKDEDNFYIHEFNEIIDIVKSIIDEGKETGEFSDGVDSKMFAQKLAYLSRGFIFSWCTQNGKYDLMGVVIKTVDLILDSIVTK